MWLLPLHHPPYVPWLTCTRRRQWRAHSLSPPSPPLLPLDNRRTWRQHQWRLSKGLNFRSIASSLSYSMQKRACVSSHILNWCNTEREIVESNTSDWNLKLANWSLKLAIDCWESFCDLRRWCFEQELGENKCLKWDLHQSTLRLKNEMI
jgi:hypothetical protein